MAGENIKYVVVAVQDYKKYGYSNTVHTDKGMSIRVEDYSGIYEYRNLTNYRKFIFEKVLGKKFGEKDIFLEPKSILFSNLLLELKLKLQDLLLNQKRVPDPENRYDDIKEILGEQYVINLRKEEDKNLNAFNRFYLNFKEYYDYNYPLYLTIATPEDEKKYFGNFKAGDHYEPIFPQKTS